MSEKVLQVHSAKIDKIKSTLSAHDFVYDRMLDNGGFSTCHIVFSNQYQMTFVCKVITLSTLFPDSANDQNSAIKYINGVMEKVPEIDIVSKLIHPNIIQVYNYFQDDFFFYIIMEYCTGGTLLNYVKKQGRLQGYLLYNTCQQMVDALAYCHQMRIAHRDIKPANILIDQYGRPKLADFGLSSIFQNNEKSKEIIGSLVFLAPEVIRREEYDPLTSDIWALGITFYFLANGKYPWSSRAKDALAMEIKEGTIQFNDCHSTKEFRDMLRKMLEIHPCKRITITRLMMHKFFTSFNPNLTSTKTNAVREEHKISKATSCSIDKFVVESPNTSSGGDTNSDSSPKENKPTFIRRRNNRRHSCYISLCSSMPFNTILQNNFAQPTFAE